MDIEDEAKGLIEIDCLVPGSWGRGAKQWQQKPWTRRTRIAVGDQDLCLRRVGLRGSPVFLKEDVKWEIIRVWIQREGLMHIEVITETMNKDEVT